MDLRIHAHMHVKYAFVGMLKNKVHMYIYEGSM